MTVDKLNERREKFNAFMMSVDGHISGSNEEMIDFMKNYGNGLIREDVFSAMKKIDRAKFLPYPLLSSRSPYELNPAPIGHGQTCSAPYVVAVFNEVLNLKPDERVLEIGSGCGYHASTVAAQMGKGEVHSFEIIEDLAKLAEKNIDKVKKTVDMADVHIHFGDASEGFKGVDDFDVIYMASSAPDDYAVGILLKQLRNNGRLVIPLEEHWGGGRVFLFEVNKESPKVECIADMAFVSLTGKKGFEI
jgi:protein-L-isoaspartate(D-aspartate) O-methyltransferase